MHYLWTNFSPAMDHLANRFAPPSPSRISHLKRLFYTPRQPCQICGKTNHQALDCYNRMHFSYQGRHPPSQLAGLTAQSNVHITDDLDHLSLQQQPYQGADTVTVGNGWGLRITQIGSSLFSSPTSKFFLANILWCPNASFNLLSIQKFCSDNNC